MSVGWGRLDGVSYYCNELKEKSGDCKVNILEQPYHKRKDLYTATLHSCIPLGSVREYSESRKKKEPTVREVFGIYMSSSRCIWRIHVKKLRYEFDRGLRTNID